MNNMKKVTGFTIIELVIAIVIIGILAAVAIPRFVDLSDDALVAAKQGMSGAVKSSHAIATADLKGFPTNAELATYVNGEGINAAINGIVVTIDGDTYTVKTYTDSNCATATGSLTAVVQCVGDI